MEKSSRLLAVVTRILGFLLIAVCLTSHLAARLPARFASGFSGEGGGRVAKFSGWTAKTATASDFVMRDGDAGECSISLDFGGLIHSKANADACYASIGLVATPVE